MSNHPPEALFRKQAIDALSVRPIGRPIAVMPKSWLWFSSLVIVFAVAGAFFLSTAEYSRKETVRGWLVASDGVVRITHNATGIVESIGTKLGAHVSAGDSLIFVSQDTFLESGRSSGNELMSELAKQSASLRRRVQLVREEADIEQSSIAMQLGLINEERKSISRGRIEQQRRLEAASNILTRLRSAASDGAISHWDVSRKEDERAVLKQALGRMKQDQLALERERDQLLARERSLPVETERTISTLNSQRSRLQQQITEQKSMRHIVLKSPIAGRLASLEVHRGAALLPNQLLATVVPESLSLVAEVYVPSSAIGFIERGQHVRLIYDAFPQQQFGAFAGVVDRISEFVLLPSEVPQTFFPREATFKIRIAIDRDFVAIEGGDAPLRPGMLLAAEIILESRSLLDWLLEPIRLRRSDVV